jgi:D-lactate dehydrogenase (cytochrome)
MNELRPCPANKECGDWRRITGRNAVMKGYAQYLADESRLAADGVEAIHFPTDADQVAAAVREICGAGGKIAVSGARTGIAGAAVPLGADAVISLEHVQARPVVRRGPSGWTVRVAAATTLAELNDALGSGDCDYPDGKPDVALFHPVDCTEMTAQIGGTIATNASGARTLFYGATRDWVLALEIVTADGRVLEIERGQVVADADGFVYITSDGAVRRVDVRDISLPVTKHTAGYHLQSGMDAVDLFVGSEGTLGIVTAATLHLAEKPANRLYMTQFVTDAVTAIAYVAACKAHVRPAPLALEYIGPRAVALLRAKGRETPAYVEVSRLPEDARAAVYVEAPFADESELDGVHTALRAAADAAGLDAAQSWAGFSDRDLEEMKRLRHAVPETVNSIIGQRTREIPGLHKVGTDLAVPDAALPEMMEFYERRLAESDLEYAIFGHMGDGHVHVNMLPASAAELATAKALYIEFAKEAVRLGGSVAAEHGIGRIKRALMSVQYSEADLAAMQAVKAALDPEGILNPGVLFLD